MSVLPTAGPWVIRDEEKGGVMEEGGKAGL